MWVAILAGAGFAALLLAVLAAVLLTYRDPLPPETFDVDTRRDKPGETH
jgi:hypothetical protein